MKRSLLSLVMMVLLSSCAALQPLGLQDANIADITDWQVKMRVQINTPTSMYHLDMHIHNNRKQTSIWSFDAFGNVLLKMVATGNQARLTVGKEVRTQPVDQWVIDNLHVAIPWKTLKLLLLGVAITQNDETTVAYAANKLLQTYTYDGVTVEIAERRTINNILLPARIYITNTHQNIKIKMLLRQWQWDKVEPDSEKNS